MLVAASMFLFSFSSTVCTISLEKRLKSPWRLTLSENQSLIGVHIAYRGTIPQWIPSEKKRTRIQHTDNWNGSRPKLVIYAPTIPPPSISPKDTNCSLNSHIHCPLPAKFTADRQTADPLLESPLHQYHFVEIRGHSTSTSEIVHPHTGTDRDAEPQSF